MLSLAQPITHASPRSILQHLMKYNSKCHASNQHQQSESTLRLFILPSNDRSGTLDSRSWHRCNQTASCLLERRLWLFRHQGWVHAAFKGTHTVECQLQNLERLALQQFAARIIRQTPLVLENAVTGAANHSRFTKKHLATSHEIQQQMLCFKPTSAE